MAGATVGGAFLSASLQVLFDRLASREVLSFIRGQKLISDALLKKLERKLVIVHAVLNDAEVKQFINSSVKKWLYLLKEAVYDAEDIFDEVATEAQRCKMEAAGYQTSTSQVGYILFTWFHAPFDNQSIEPRVEEIIDRLEDIAHDRDALGLKEGVGEKPSQRWPSTSLVDESLVYGRDGEKQKIIELLLSDDARSDEIGVISIVGMCGAGKTTLAQLLYNDQTVKEHFDLKAWVWVSEEFDPIKVTKTILEAIQEFDPNSQEAITNDLNLLQLQLKESINMKKFLLILDDVWNEDSNNWDKLRTPLIVGSKGSKIVVTTRSTNVAIAMRAFHTHCLGGLSFEDSWLLFKKLVFETEDSSIHPQLEAIGKIIVVKCQGLPLAIKALGSFLRSKTEAREWDDILKSKMCQWSSNELLPALTLSYYHLPSQLKRCFAYCSIFPKDYEFNKEKLILLWMAEGLLQEDFSKQMEERLSLEACPELLFERESLPLDLRELEISNCNKLTPRVDWGLQRVASLTHFTIRNGCEDMELFPGECLLPSTLTSLEIEHLPNLKSLESKGLQQLTSLTKLSILNCPKFQSFGEVGLQHLTSLRHIQISYCPVLKSLTDVGLQHLISLEELWVIDCPKLQYLAKERLSNSLSCLTIKECPLLEHRCQFGKGQYWHYIAHIPHIIINDVLY